MQGRGTNGMDGPITVTSTRLSIRHLFPANRRCMKSSVLGLLVLVTLLVVYKVLELSPPPLLVQSSQKGFSSLLRLMGQNDDQTVVEMTTPEAQKTDEPSYYWTRQFVSNPPRTTPRKLVSRKPPEKDHTHENQTTISVSSEKRNTTFRLPTKPLLHGEHKGETTKLIVWHMIPRYRKHGPDRITACGEYKCVVSSNKSKMAEADVVIVDAFLLSRNRVKDKPVRTSPNQAFVFYSREPWNGYSSLFPQSWDFVFNWTLTYQSNSDIHTPYGELIFKGEPKNKPDWSAIMKKKTQSVFWLVSNCNARSKRMEYVKEMQKHIDVLIVGKCSALTCDPNVTDRDNDDVTPCYEKSRFYLSFESAYCKDYVTEKFFRTFKYNIIPIVRGKANYSKNFPKDLFINTADYPSPKELAGYLKYLQNNETAYLGYLKRRAQYSVGSDWFKTCHVCSFAHNLEKHRRSYPSITSWIDPCDSPKQPHLH